MPECDMSTADLRARLDEIRDEERQIRDELLTRGYTPHDLHPSRTQISLGRFFKVPTRDAVITVLREAGPGGALMADICKRLGTGGHLSDNDHTRESTYRKYGPEASLIRPTIARLRKRGIIYTQSAHGNPGSALRYYITR